MTILQLNAISDSRLYPVQEEEKNTIKDVIELLTKPEYERQLK